ncbi:MAG: hypothetical protein V8S34_05665 [Lawsonibacter sp.]
MILASTRLASGRERKSKIFGSVEREGFHVFVRGDPVQGGEETVDVLHPHQAALHPGGHVHLGGDARPIARHGDGIQIELQSIGDGVILIPRDVLKGVLDLQGELVARGDGPGGDEFICLAVPQLER